MVLSKSTWYMKAYFFIQSWWSFSKGKSWDGRKYKEGEINSADICTFMRAFIFKLPILLVAHLCMYWMIFFTFFQFPIEYLGFSGYFVAIMVIIGAIGMGFGAYIGERKLRCYFDSKPSKPARTDPTFLNLFCTWIKARHDKICVLITFEDG